MEIEVGIVKEPHFVLVFGPDGCGKTTFAANAPKSIIVGPEAGSKRINVARAKGINTYSDIVKAIEWLTTEKHDFKSVGIDSLDWIEPLIWADVCEKHQAKSIEEVGGGYGKGYTMALDVHTKLISMLKELRDKRGMNVIVIAHSQVKTVNDPMHPMPYDRHMLKLNDKASAKWREAVDAVLFANFEDMVFKANKNDRKAKATEGNVRKLYTTRRAAFDAKNRYGLPEELPLSWDAFANAADVGQPDSREQVEDDLKELLPLLNKDSLDKAAAAIGKAQGDLTKLINIRNYCRVLVEKGE